MKTIDLKLFCLEYELRNIPMEPFSSKDFTYATDGRIAIRVARRQEVPENNYTSTIVDVIERYIKDANFDIIADWLTIDAVPLPEMKGCDDCGETGYYDPEEDDPKFQCQSCDGKGKYPIFVSVEIGAKLFSNKYLLMLMELPNVRIHATNGKLDSSPFKFDGGIGILMPMKSPKTK